MSRVRLADNVQISVVSLAGFPSNDLSEEEKGSCQSVALSVHDVAKAMACVWPCLAIDIRPSKQYDLPCSARIAS